MVWDTFLLKDIWHTCCQAAEVDNRELDQYIDASGSRSLGAIFGMECCAEEWLVQWKESELFLELFPIVVVVELWG